MLTLSILFLSKSMNKYMHSIIHVWLKIIEKDAFFHFWIFSLEQKHHLLSSKWTYPTLTKPISKRHYVTKYSSDMNEWMNVCEYAEWWVVHSSYRQTQRKDNRPFFPSLVSTILTVWDNCGVGVCGKRNIFISHLENANQIRNRIDEKKKLLSNLPQVKNGRISIINSPIKWIMEWELKS